MIYRLMTALMRSISRGYLGRGLKITGRERIPLRGPTVFVGNHIGTVDPPMTGAFIPRSDLYYMAKEEYFRNSLSRLIFRWYHAFPVSRGNADRRALSTAFKIIQRGGALLIYPEGTRSPEAAMLKPKAGIGFVLKHAGETPVIPVAIAGSEHILPKKAKFPKRRKMSITFGTPFTPRLNDEHGHELPNAVIAIEVMAKVAELLPPKYQGIYEHATVEELIAEELDAAARKSSGEKR